jgi:hypothetical protein
VGAREVSDTARRGASDFGLSREIRPLHNPTPLKAGMHHDGAGGVDCALFTIRTE